VTGELCSFDVIVDIWIAYVTHTCCYLERERTLTLKF